MSRKIYTHYNPDLDAAISVWAVKRFLPEFKDAEVVFVPANWKGDELQEEDIAVDIEAGGKGFKGEIKEGKRRSAFVQILDYFGFEKISKILEPIANFVDRLDAGEPVYEEIPRDKFLRDYYCTTLAGVWRALAVALKDSHAALNRFFDIMDGILSMRLERLQAEEEAKKAAWVDYGRLKAAIIDNPTAMGVNAVLFENGADAVVFIDGNNIGAVRSDRHGDKSLDHPAVREVVAEESGWFFHPAGFLVARGTRKSPAETPSKVSGKDLALAALKALHD